MRILVLQGPNINALGLRDVSHYGTVTMDEIHRRLEERAAALGCEVECFQSNHEGALVDRIQEAREKVSGVIINPAALTGTGYSLRDAIEDSQLPTVDVHLSNIHAREEFRRHSVISPVALGQIAGFRWRGYLAALAMLFEFLND